jgi:hypothetical protein
VHKSTISRKEDVLDILSRDWGDSRHDSADQNSTYWEDIWDEEEYKGESVDVVRGQKDVVILPMWMLRLLI